MAVFTPVSFEAAAAFVAAYGVGELETLEPIAEGVENTNYKARVGGRAYVLTLFEKRARAEDLAGQLALMQHWANDDLPAPRPVTLPDGPALRRLCERPAAMLSWRPGAWPRQPSPAQARNAGAMLAKLHASGSAAAVPPHRFGPAVWQGWLDRIQSAPLTGDQGRLAVDLAAELRALNAIWPKGLREAAIHADYFPDNVLFEGDVVTGVIDAYFAGRDARAYDLAVAFAAWGFDAQGDRLDGVGEALVSGYTAEAPLTAAERDALPILARGAAARFTLSRLHDLVFHDPAWIVTPKDPAAFHRRLKAFRARPEPAAFGL